MMESYGDLFASFSQTEGSAFHSHSLWQNRFIEAATADEPTKSSDTPMLKRSEETDYGIHPEDRVGTIIAGHYEVMALIGSGGMGVIYKARDRQLERLCAIKMLNLVQRDTKILRRFRQEAAAASHLFHPNLIRVHDFGFSEDGCPFMVMDLIEGISLADLLKDVGCLSFTEALPIFLQICNGMHYAHSRQVLHRDLKPGNIMLTQNEAPGPAARIVDFGIAKFDDQLTGQANGVTHTGEIFGSPLYMSPEQANGQPVDQSTDIYSMGCLMYETLTGRPPFRGASSLQTMIQHLTEVPPSLEEHFSDGKFPAALEEIVAKCLKKQACDRYQSMVDLGAALSSVLANQTASVESRPPLTKARTPHSYALLLLIICSALLTRWCLSHPALKTQLKTSVLFSNNRARPTGITTLSPESIGTTFKFDQAPAGKVTPSLAAKAPCFDLSVANNLIDDVALEPIGRMIALQSLNLSGSGISDRGLAYLTELRTLRQINLSHTATTGKGCLSLSKLNSLSDINLSHSLMDDEGLLYLKDLPLESLALSGDEISNKGLLEISHMSHLRRLWLNDTAVTDEGLTQLSSLRFLTRLGLASNQLTDRGAKTIAKQKTLRSLDLSQTEVGDKGLESISTLPLESLNLSGCARVSNRGLALLGKIATLRELRLGHTSVTDAGIPYICRLPQLKVLYIGSTNLSDRGIRFLSSPSSSAKMTIVELHVDNTDISGRGLLKLSALPSLQTLYISGLTVNDATAAGLAKMKGLRKLCLRNCNISDKSKKLLRANLSSTKILL